MTEPVDSAQEGAFITGEASQDGWYLAEIGA
jgi:hypothetical protein